MMEKKNGVNVEVVGDDITYFVTGTLKQSEMISFAYPSLLGS